METFPSNDQAPQLSLEEELAYIRGPRDKQQLYVNHEGTIKISKGTPAWRAGLAAFHQYRRGTRPLEFVYIGGAAGEQAIKAANVCIRAIHTYLDEYSVGIFPIWRLVQMRNPDGSYQLKEANILRLVHLTDNIKDLIAGLPVIV